MTKGGLSSRRALIGLVAGGALAASLFSLHDVCGALSAASLVGGGFVLVVAWRFVSLALAAGGWRLLFAPSDRPSPFALLLARWIGESVNTLLPVAQVGGDIARARVLLRRRASDDSPRSLLATIAAIIADITINLGGQAMLALLGAWQPWRSAAGNPLQITAACVVAFLPLVLMVFVQRPKMLDGVHGRFTRWLGLPDESESTALGASMAAIHARPVAIAGAVLFHCVAALSRAMEVWIILWLMATPVGIMNAIMIEGLSSALRTAAFLLPAGLGIQEGALLVLCGWIGIPPSQALALALIKRGREIAVGLGGLAIWLVLERPRLCAD